MYFNIKPSIQFRNYETYGLITDNSLFGYRFLHDDTKKLGERYVSETGSVFLSALSKIPKHINVIVETIAEQFIGVSFYEIKEDAIMFFNQLVSLGYLSTGNTAEECIANNMKKNTGTVSGMNTFNSEIETGSFCADEKPIKSLHIEIANMCNERCVHCYIPHTCKVRTIDSGLFYKILKQGREANILNVTLSGGEPLLHKDILLFFRRCRELDLSVNLLSNLILLDDLILEELRKNPLMSVQTSIYSLIPSVHDSITKVDGSLKKTTDAVLKLVSLGIPVQIVCPVMKENKDCFWSVLDWGKLHNIPVKVDYMIFGQYDHTGINLEHRISIDDINEILEKQFIYNKKYFEDLYEQAVYNEQLTSESPVCSICRFYFCVSAEGYAFPCAGWQEFRIGNLNLETIADVWNKSAKVKYLRNLYRSNFPQCINCKDRGYCTLCIMKNFNETVDKNIFRLNDFNCRMAALLHSKIKYYLGV